MKVIQFYPEIIERDSFVSRFIFEPGGLFINKDSRLYYNDEPITFVISGAYELARPTETFKFVLSADPTQSVTIKADDINKKGNMRELVTKFVSAERTKINKAEKARLLSDLELASVDTLIDYALETRNEELFNKLVAYRTEVAAV